MTASRARTMRYDQAGTRWEIALRPPPAHLRPYLHDMCGYDERSPGPLVRREMPAPQVVVIFEFGPPIRIQDHTDPRVWHSHAGGFVAGLSEGPAVCEHLGQQRGLQANFTPIGARLFFGLPMSELFSRVVGVADLLPREHRALTARLAELPDWDARFDLLEQLVQSRIDEARDASRVVHWAYRRIEESGGAIDIGGLARDLGYSRKHVVALFRDHVGMAPKQLARMVRFDRLIRHLRAGGAGSWSELAMTFGYADQAHLVREVRRFSGTTPTETRASFGAIDQATVVAR